MIAVHLPCSLFPTQYNLMTDRRWVLPNSGIILWLSFTEFLSSSYTFKSADVMTICFIWSKPELILVRQLRVKLSSFHFSQWFICIYIFFLASLLKYKIYSKEHCILIFNIELHKFVILTLWQNMIPLVKGLANHFSILALRTPWTIWKGKKMWHWKMNFPGW